MALVGPNGTRLPSSDVNGRHIINVIEPACRATMTRQHRAGLPGNEPVL